MANTTSPRGSRFNGLFFDGVNSQLKVYRRGTLVLTLANNDLTVADALLVDDIQVSTGGVLPQALTIGGVVYTFPVDDGTAGQQLQTDGAGVLTWAASGV